MLNLLTRHREQARLHAAFASPADLAIAVARALGAGDAFALQCLLVTRREFTECVWPAFPARNSDFTFAPDLAWTRLQRQCVRGIDKWSARFGGRGLAVLGVRFDRPPRRYGDVRILDGPVIEAVIDRGALCDIGAVESIVEIDGRCKPLSYSL